MMTVNELNYAAASAADERANSLRHWIGMITALVDVVMVLAIVIGTSFAYHLYAYADFGNGKITLELASMIAAIFVFINALRGRYQLANYLSTKGQIASAFTVWNMAMVAFIAFVFLAKIVDHYSRVVVIVTYLAGIPLVALARSGIVRAVSMASKTGRITSERVFLIGRESEVMSFVSRHQPWNIGFSIVDVAFLRSSDARRINDPAAALTADLAAASARARDLKPDAVFIALPWSDQETIDACVDAFMNLPVAIHMTPEPIMDRFENPHIVRVGSLASLRLTRPALSFTQVTFKRVFDICAASAILVASLPLLLLIALAIRIDSKGPVLFLQRRYGFNQEPFRIFKFRTMTTTDDGAVIRQATRGDPRITRVGRHLRRYNLDELPQLINVIAGQMSLVGPRPHALAHDREYQRKIALYARRHNVKPGITGWAQVNGLRGETDTDEKMARRVAYDHWYIDNWSFWLDLAILLRTLFSPRAFRNAG
ncbi:undecaprenyl-phosphate glucose phosphotransferase [Bosea sp. (in: a-proteobacteria)]|jgi:Undecaprenyl-phosphate glucose phosphotransferase|uniref:undecaprenyl-phosphate glucose phosphotransferase n=2 Tax=Bosea sp. (in: a-proteobacteria) TaxID=1871050 RepID=UPI001AC038AF|nr:undecaprenyl-phosphate glucose phosphotransferase [Bosea sp. (in: a-proteobacteria)]MBN9436752.1 undecaprenyl-phosphate glucose phosphotransferase [Bosea sp. (in: a-proteobacteria)]MBN9468827.1 undecaprenyl-phosphate glucose phosphotransferase [Bosea sp. (in: a-proteobacteria)]